MANTKCSFCNIAYCPFVVREQCPMKSLADKADTMMQKVNDVGINLVVTVESISAN